jgi:hypothetical protein
MCRVFRCLIILLTFSATAYCQQLIEGTIVDTETGKPVSFASVGILGTSKGTSSNVDGQFSLFIDGAVSLKITCVGYESLVIPSSNAVQQIKLKPVATQLSAIVVSDKAINPKRIVRKAFSKISENYFNHPLLQKFFYRHYCKDDSVYGRLIEASVDVWKNEGYRSFQKVAGEKEEIRVTHLRRSLDKTIMAQGHEPISIGTVLQADLIGYQTAEKSEHISFFSDVNNLKTDFESYFFTFKGITDYDEHDVYIIGYEYKKDSVLTTSGAYLQLAKIEGTLFITTDDFAIVKAEEVKSYGESIFHSSAYYRKYDHKYYPYHFVREGESRLSATSTHSFRIDLMLVEMSSDIKDKFVGRIPTREELLNIQYDSVFWSKNTVLKTTPLEDEIINHLGGGTSLDKQFYLYHQYEMNLRDGGQNGEEKLSWLLQDSKGKRILYLLFWSGNFQSYLTDLELAKHLQKKHLGKISFIFVSTDDDETRWQQTLKKYNFFTNGIINYRVGGNSKIVKTFDIKDMPSFILVAPTGEFDLHAKRPSNPLLEYDFKFLLEHDN